MHGTLLSELNAGIVDELLAAPMDPVAFIQIRHLGGALTRPTTIPAGAITEPYYISFAGLPTAEQGRDVIEARIADYLDIVAPARSGRTPFNFLTPQQNAADALDPDTLGRLREIKLRHDPTGVFRSNHPVLA
jgi:hypothetical protein